MVEDFNLSFYAARQPILNKDKTLFAYELLFRQSLENVFPKINDNQATAKLIEGLQFNLGLETLTEGTLAFINFTHDSLIDGYPLLLPKDQIVVEILETAKPTKNLLNTCIDLKEKGYILALDDYEHDPIWKHFFPYIDIIKIDYKLSSEEQIRNICEECKPYKNIKLLAEKVETYQEFEHALALGCDYFQGYFFSKPEVIRSIAFNPSQLSVIKLMAEVNKPEPNILHISSIFEGDAELSFKLLRYAQSPAFKRAKKIENLKQAVVMFGIAELKRFISLLFTAQFSEGKPQQLTLMALVRARFCENMVVYSQSKAETSSAFLIGLLSLLDAMVDANLADLMEKLPISQEMKDTLIRKYGEIANYLTLCECLEKAEWDKAEQLSQSFGFDFMQILDNFQLALAWSSERIKMV